MGTVLGSQTGGARRLGAKAAPGADNLNMICQIVAFHVTAAPGARNRSLLAATLDDEVLPSVTEDVRVSTPCRMYILCTVRDISQVLW